MHQHIVRLAAVAVLFFPIAVSAQQAPKPVEIRSFGSLSIKPGDLPAGCRVTHMYGEVESGLITCDTESQFNAGFAVSDNFKSDCATTADNKWRCVITEN